MKNMENQRKIVIGYYLPRKKVDKLRVMLEKIHRIEDSRFSSLLQFMEIDFKGKHQDKFDAILHKISHDMVLRHMNQESRRRVEWFTSFIKDNPRIPIIDPLSSIEPHINRKSSMVAINELAKVHGALFRVPKFAVIEEDSQISDIMKNSNLTIPVICKPIDACATKESHLLSIVLDKSELCKVKPPVLIQEYINHGQKLFKVYVLGGIIRVFDRVSLPDIDKEFILRSHEKAFVEFDSQNPYTECALHGSLRGASEKIETNQSILARQSDHQLTRIAEIIRDHMKLTLFGLDIIESRDTGEYHVVDLNYFPSFKEVDKLEEYLVHHIVSRIDAMDEDLT